MGRHREGYAFAKVGLDLNGRLDHTPLNARLNFFFAVTLVFTQPLRVALSISTGRTGRRWSPATPVSVVHLQSHHHRPAGLGP